MAFDWIMVVVGALLTLGTGVFVAAEFTLVNLDRADLEARRDRGERRLGSTINALKITSTHLSGAQLGITLTTLLAGFALEPALARLLTPVLGGLGVPSGAVSAIAGVAGVVIATIGSMLLGELVPKNVALALPVAVAKFVVPLQSGFTIVFKPLVLLLNGASRVVVQALGVRPQEELSGARTAEELTSLVRRSAVEGTLGTEQAALLGRSLRFADRVAADVMTHRVRMETVARRDTAQQVIELAQKTGVSRFPVVGAGLDDIRGLMHVKNAYAITRAERDTVAADELMVQPLQVPDTVGVDVLLPRLRRAGSQAAVVVDEYGGTAGMVTIEDVIEELVGDVADEHDREEPRVIRTRNDELILDATLRPDELQAMAGIWVPESSDYETVAGFVAEQLGRIAEAGDEVPVNGGVFQVLVVDERHVDRLRFFPRADGDTDVPGRSGNHRWEAGREP